MKVIDRPQDKKKSQVRYSNVVVVSGVIIFILLVIVLKVQQLLA
jgi:hypothetical protein